MLVLWIDDFAAIVSFLSGVVQVLGLWLAISDLVHPFVVVPIVGYFEDSVLVDVAVGDAGTRCGSCYLYAACRDVPLMVAANENSRVPC